MESFTLGNIGHLLVITAFVFALVCMYAYWQSVRQTIDSEKIAWKKLGRVAFLIHGVAVVGVVISLFLIIYHHQYQYHYAWSHSSNNLPTHYMISCFWEGQEGSFLLWIFWHVLIGLFLLKSSKEWEASVMTIFAFVQAFLVSMILGIMFGELKIGSSPFILLRDAIDAPIFKTNPDFVPVDGTGLNPLLQNYWMVIHPPTLFLGFALTLVPFAYCIAGLWQKRWKEWVNPAQAWNNLAAMILGIGIMMGAYWAYETLNFGGYWNWDPVENAVYIPWLVMIASIHTMLIFKKNGTALKTSIILVIATFVLILYSTFLTRSGVLGNASVHSFTDLGLSGQLLIYLLAFLGLAVILLATRWKLIPSDEKETSVYSPEFWIFAGATVLCLAGFQVLVPTSIPVYNQFMEFFGVSSNIAPPTDQVQFYTKFQLWFAIGVALLSAMGQFFWWKKVDKSNLKDLFSYPIATSLLISSLIFTLASVRDWKLIILLTVSIFAVISNALTISRLLKISFSKLILSGGALSHIGIAIMLIGILFSAGYSKVISLNVSGQVYNEAFPEEMNKENLLLFRNEPRQMQEYLLTYKGQRKESEDVPSFIDKELLFPTNDPFRMIAKEDLAYQGKIYAKKGDTIQVYHENTYYEIEYTDADGQTFTLYPRLQENPQMGAVASPDISHFWDKDLYTHITNLSVDEDEVEWSKPESIELHIGDTAIIHDYFVVLDNVVKENSVIGTTLNEGDFAVKAKLRALGRFKHHDIEPIFLIKDKMAGMIPATKRDLGIQITFESINPNAGTFLFSYRTTQKDWVILKAVEKPYIHLLWAGTLLMGMGLSIAAYRRFSEKKITERVRKEEMLEV
ncbi:MAG: cytochrome c biogenesis protein CcsA [Flammeovirgaceae bacterium]